MLSASPRSSAERREARAPNKHFASRTLQGLLESRAKGVSGQARGGAASRRGRPLGPARRPQRELAGSPPAWGPSPKLPKMCVRWASNKLTSSGFPGMAPDSPGGTPRPPRTDQKKHVVLGPNFNGRLYPRGPRSEPRAQMQMVSGALGSLGFRA